MAKIRKPRPEAYPHLTILEDISTLITHSHDLQDTLQNIVTTVRDRMEAEEPGSVDYPFSGPMFLLTHRPLERPDPEVTILSGDIGEAVATALDAAGGKNLEVLGADVAGQCLQRGLVDEILVYVLPVLLGDGIRFSSPGLARTDLEPLSSTRSGDATILRFRVRKQPD